MVKGEIRKLCQSVDKLTEAVQALLLELRSQKRAAPLPEPAARMKPGPVPDPTVTDSKVCVDTQCGQINNDRSLCDHTRERYRSEYNCG